MNRVRDVALVLETAVVCARARMALARGGLPRALSVFELDPVEQPRTRPPTGRWTRSSRRVALVAGAVLGRAPVRSSCLPTALSLATVLERRDVPADVVLGVSLDDGFSAHAWIEVGEGRIDLAGHPLNAHRELLRLRRRPQPVRT